MKRIFYISLASLVISLTSCEQGINPETAKAFVGEYWMKTTSYSMYKNEVVEEPNKAVWSPVSIYEENGKLYVRTDHFGDPDTVTTEGAKHEFILNYTDHPNYAPTINMSIEPVEEDGVLRVFVMDGFIWSMKGGILYRSQPIQVKSGSEKVLNLCEFQPINIALTSLSGEILEIVKIGYDYGPIVKAGDSLTWEVVLPLDFERTSSEGAIVRDRVVHKNTLYKR